jgi:hypothetical protein
MEEGGIEVNIGKIVTVNVSVKRNNSRTEYVIEYDRETNVLERITLVRSHSKDVVISRETLREIIAILEQLRVKLC